MARSLYRAGTYRLTTQTSAECPIRVDNQRFIVPPNASLDINSNDFWSYDSDTYTNLKVYRTPSNPVTITQSVGGTSRLNPSGNTNVKVPNINARGIK